MSMYRNRFDDIGTLLFMLIFSVVTFLTIYYFCDKYKHEYDFVTLDQLDYVIVPNTVVLAKPKNTNRIYFMVSINLIKNIIKK